MAPYFRHLCLFVKMSVVGYSYSARLIYRACFNSKATPVNDTNYSCYVKAVELV